MDYAITYIEIEETKIYFLFFVVTSVKSTRWIVPILSVRPKLISVGICFCFNRWIHWNELDQLRRPITSVYPLPETKRSLVQMAASEVVSSSVRAD